jgi:hypothetical protein
MKSLQHYVQLICHVDAFVATKHEYKNSTVAEIGLLHSQPFTNSHFHFLIAVEGAKIGQITQCAWRLF